MNIQQRLQKLEETILEGQGDFPFAFDPMDGYKDSLRCDNFRYLKQLGYDQVGTFGKSKSTFKGNPSYELLRNYLAPDGPIKVYVRSFYMGFEEDKDNVIIYSDLRLKGESSGRIMTVLRIGNSWFKPTDWLAIWTHIANYVIQNDNDYSYISV